MKKKSSIEKIIIIISFFLVISYPYIASFFKLDEELNGAEEKIEFSLENIDDYIIQNLPGRSLLIKLKNQFLYSTFDISPNSSIAKVGDTLLSTETLNYFYHDLHYVTEDDTKELVDKFKRFDDFCKKNDKKMVLVLTPTKVRYYKGKLPFADDVILLNQNSDLDFNDRLEMLPYKVFLNSLKGSGLNYFDAISYIDRNLDRINRDVVPLFYKSGHHWSIVQANRIGLEFHKYLRDHMDIIIPTVAVKASPSDVAIFPDDDLFKVLNVYSKPNEKFYESVITYDNLISDNIDWTIQGGSFLGGLLLPYITVSAFGEVYHIENKVLLHNFYKDTDFFDSFDELNKSFDLINHLKKTDVYIFEINEINVYNATFGFLDYLLEHLEEI